MSCTGSAPVSLEEDVATPSLQKTIKPAFIKDSWSALWFNCFIFIEPFGPKNINMAAQKRGKMNSLLYVIKTDYRSDPCRKTVETLECSGRPLLSFSYQSFGLILLSNTRTDPSPRPAAMSERWESQDKLVTQLSAPVGMSWWSRQKRKNEKKKEKEDHLVNNDMFPVVFPLVQIHQQVPMVTKKRVDCINLGGQPSLA